jgi:phosphohistidine phosphatase SixA
MPSHSHTDKRPSPGVALGLLRHSLAEKRNAEKFPDDALRPLTHEGFKLAKQVARGLKAISFEPHCILTSPYVRTRQTAECLADVLGIRKQNVIDAVELAELAPMRASIPALVKRLRKFRSLSGSPAETVLLVGHEPFLSQWLAYSIAGLAEKEGAHHDFHFPKCGFAWVVGHPFRAGQGRLTHMLPPALLKRLRP